MTLGDVAGFLIHLDSKRFCCNHHDSGDFNGTVGAVYGKMESIQILFQFLNYIKIEDAKDPITMS